MYQADILTFTTQNSHPGPKKTHRVDSCFDTVKKYSKSVTEVVLITQNLSVGCSQIRCFTVIVQLYEVVVSLKTSRKLVHSTPLDPG